ncbi:unnamed protein product [Angiostrongylus costaricensis]|uniref:SET domain-containing protein n=1 Tax=Angiostrongylus costaricensis TaxID=334426 RepID=A0A0R3PVZ0_ANGCS|nr:unnamed protein product [Angiostrongylus costaricensis]
MHSNSFHFTIVAYTLYIYIFVTICINACICILGWPALARRSQHIFCFSEFCWFNHCIPWSPRISQTKVCCRPSPPEAVTALVDQRDATIYICIYTCIYLYMCIKAFLNFTFDNCDSIVVKFADCDRCNCYYRASCKEHPLFWVKDREPVSSCCIFLVFISFQNTAPAFISIKTSSIPNAGLGAFAEACIPKSLYSQIFPKVCSDGPHFMDGSNTQYSNWMRYINSSRHDKEQNLLAFQYCGGVYYRVIRPIKMKEELLVWYGKKFGKSLGVFTTLRSLKRPSTPANKNPFIL